MGPTEKKMLELSKNDWTHKKFLQKFINTTIDTHQKMYFSRKSNELEPSNETTLNWYSSCN